MSWNLLTIREFLLRQCFRQLAFAVVCTEQAHDLVIQLDFFPQHGGLILVTSGSHDIY